MDPVKDKIRPGDGLIIRTGWSRFVNLAKYRDGLPRISEELAQWLVEKKVGILGVEPPSVADVNNIDEVTLIHRILLGGNVIVVEGMMNLEQISAEKVQLNAYPLKIADGDGAPARVFVIEK